MSRCDLVTAAKNVNPRADTSQLEGEINQLVAPRQLYGLTEGEIQFIENNQLK